MHPLTAALIGGGAAGKVSFDGATISGTGGAFASASVAFSADGTYSKFEGTVETALGNWIDPQVGMKRHQIRFTNAANSNASSSQAAEDVWWSFLDGDFAVGVSVGISSSASDTLDIEVRRGEGAALDTAEFSLSASTL